MPESAATCEHDECYWGSSDGVPGDLGVCCDCGAGNPESMEPNDE